MIAVIDYGMGNLRSVQKALQKVGGDARITHDAQQILAAERVVLPGVGAMGAAMDKLTELGLVNSIHQVIQSGRPFLGICVGLQLMFESSEEGTNTRGLGVFEGGVKKFSQLKVPQMGWNELTLTQRDCPLFEGISDGAEVYFCHSYYVDPDDSTIEATSTDYGIRYTSAVRRDNVFGVQFHPEKSQTVGLHILKNFVGLSI